MSFYFSTVFIEYFITVLLPCKTLSLTIFKNERLSCTANNHSLTKRFISILHAVRDGNEGNYLEFFQTPFILLKDLEKSILCVFLVRHDGTSHEIRKCNSVDECKMQLFTRKLSHAHTRLKNVI